MRFPLSRLPPVSQYSAALLAFVLAEEGIPSLIWGPAAAACYGGNFCILDIELAVPDDLYGAACAVLLKGGLHVSSPHGAEMDRRHFRHDFPTFDVPEYAPVGREHIILYPSSFLGIFYDHSEDPTTSGTIVRWSVERWIEAERMPMLSQHLDIYPPRCAYPVPPRDLLVCAELHVMLVSCIPSLELWAHHLSGIAAILDENIHFPSALQPFASVLLRWQKDRDNSTRSLLSELPKLRAVYFNAIGQARNADVLQWARDELAISHSQTTPARV